MIKALLKFVTFITSPVGKIWLSSIIQFARAIYLEIEKEHFKTALKDGVEIAKRNKDPRKLLSILRKRT